jgi:hypothetical protein
MITLNLTQDAQALPYGPLTVGMPVITTDQPCTKLVAVVTGFTGTSFARMSYLSTWDMIIRADIADIVSEITPLSAFGVAIEIKDGAFRCVEIDGMAKTAVYRDGERRHWQQTPSDRVWWPYRPEVLKMLDRRWVL